MDLSFPSTEPVEQPQQTSTADAHQPEEQTTQDAIEDPTQEPPLKSEQDIKIEAQQAKKIKALEDKIAVLKAQIEETKAKKAVVDEQLKTNDPEALVKNHIRLLHTYNEIRDIGTGLLGMVADQRGCRIRDVYEEFGVGEDD